MALRYNEPVHEHLFLAIPRAERRRLLKK